MGVHEGDLQVRYRDDVDVMILEKYYVVGCK